MSYTHEFADCHGQPEKFAKIQKREIMKHRLTYLAATLAASFPCHLLAEVTPVLTLDSTVITGSRVEHNFYMFRKK